MQHRHPEVSTIVVGENLKPDTLPAQKDRVRELLERIVAVTEANTMAIQRLEQRLAAVERPVQQQVSRESRRERTEEARRRSMFFSD